MNFRLTPLKSIVSLIFGVLVNYLLAGMVRITCIEGIYCPQPTWIKFAFDSAPLTASIIVTIVIYVVWSLIQRHK